MKRSRQRILSKRIENSRFENFLESQNLVASTKKFRVGAKIEGARYVEKAKFIRCRRLVPHPRASSSYRRETQTSSCWLTVKFVKSSRNKVGAKFRIDDSRRSSAPVFIRRNAINHRNLETRARTSTSDKRARISSLFSNL